MITNCPRVFVTLIHFPVYNKARQIVATSLTTLNLHDLARLAVTYGAQGLYVVTPLQRQQELARQLIDHWTRGYGAVYNPTRAEALQYLHVVDDLETAKRDIVRRCGVTPCCIATDARRFPRLISYDKLRQKFREPEAVFLLLLGTGWGLTEELIAQCEYVLEPICGPTSYNHLPVRVAAGIMLDRLLGVSDTTSVLSSPADV
jgi:hypothetical protein